MKKLILAGMLALASTPSAWAQSYKPGAIAETLVAPEDLKISDDSLSVSTAVYQMQGNREELVYKPRTGFSRQELRCLERQMEVFLAATAIPEFMKFLRSGVVKTVQFDLLQNTAKLMEDKDVPYMLSFTEENGVLMIESVLNSKGQCFTISAGQILSYLASWKRLKLPASGARAQDLGRRIHKKLRSR